MKSILVTGAAGFLGSHLCDRLVEQGTHVVGMDNLLTGRVENLAELPEDRFRFLQGWEITHVHENWIDTVRPRFGPEIAARFAWAATVSEAMAEEAATARERFTIALDGLLVGGVVLCLPTAPMIAPRLDEPVESFLAYRDRTLTLTCTAGLARLPQVTLPVGRVDGAPVGLSLIGRRGTDRALLDFAVAVAAEMA